MSCVFVECSPELLLSAPFRNFQVSDGLLRHLTPPKYGGGGGGGGGGGRHGVEEARSFF